MVNPLYIYVGLAAASLGGLVALSHDRWEHWPKSAELAVGVVGTAAPAQPQPAAPEAAAPAPAPAPAPSASAAPPAATPSATTEAKPEQPSPAGAAPAATAPASPAGSGAPAEAKSAEPATQKSDIEQELAALGQPQAQPVQPESAVGDKPEKPSFDIVRVDPEGQAVVAGRSEPGWQVDVKINGETKGKT